MNKLIFGIAILTAVSAQARVSSALDTTRTADLAEVSTPVRLLGGVQSDMYNPVLSTDGSKLTFSRADYSNLREYDFNDNVTVNIGVTRAQALNYRPDQAAVSVHSEGSELVITEHGTERRLHPVDCAAGYCWASISPDGTKIVFLAAGKGLVVCDMQGNVLSRPGNFEAPVWFGNDYLVVQNATDDGHQIHSSQIVLLKADGSAMQALTKPESMAMTPAASISAGRIVYSTIDGRMYQMNVKLK